MSDFIQKLRNEGLSDADIIQRLEIELGRKHAYIGELRGYIKILEDRVHELQDTPPR